MQKIEYRSYIKVRGTLGISTKKIAKELEDAYPGEAPSYQCVAKWARQFRGNRESVEDDPRPGPPITAHTKRNIELVRSIIIEDPHATYDIIEAETELSCGTIHAILHDSLNLRKVTSRWVPHKLTNSQKQQRVTACRKILAMFEQDKWRLCDVVTGDQSWFYQRKIGHKQSNAAWIGIDESPKTVVRRSLYEPKTMFTIFFRTSGPVYIDRLDKGETITSTYYIENVLKPLFKELKKQRPKSGLTNIKILHDNARPHTAKNTFSFLEDEGVAIIDHPPYSPDLAPCDFWLFDYLKRNLGDYTDEIKLGKAITKVLNGIPKEEYAKTFSKWLERMQICINNGGDYFEHLLK